MRLGLGQDKAEVLSRLQTTQNLVVGGGGGGGTGCLTFILVQREAALEKCVCLMCLFLATVAAEWTIIEKCE